MFEGYAVHSRCPILESRSQGERGLSDPSTGFPGGENSLAHRGLTLRFADIEPTSRSFWAKSGETGGHSLLCHMFDVAAVAEALLAREPASTLKWASGNFGFQESDVVRAVAARVGAHDLGKTLPGFQSKWAEGRARMESLGLPFPCEARLANRSRHDAAAFDLFASLLTSIGIADPSAREFARALAAHHGRFPHGTYARGMEPPEWNAARKPLLRAYWDLLGPAVPMDRELSAPAMAWFAGLTAVADWVGSNTEWFPPGERGDTLQEHWSGALKLAGSALDAIGWPSWKVMDAESGSAADLVGRMIRQPGVDARPLQQEADHLLQKVQGPTLVLVEAPMGEGKTELAFLAHLRLQARNEHRGMYVALPTQATANAMFDRALAFLQEFGAGQRLDIQLIHGGALLDERILRLRGIGDLPGDSPENVTSSAWFSARKRALLSPYGVGTVDQALLGTLNVKHHFVRLWGLSNRVIVLDEVHAYDTYTGGLIESMLRWLKGLNCSVILMSATLPARRRTALLRAWGAADIPDLSYPRVLVASEQGTHGTTFPARPMASIQIQGLAEDFESLGMAALDSIREGGCAAVIVNTVHRAQELYRWFQAAGDADLHLLLFHARFPAEERQARAEAVLKTFGKASGTLRPARAILVATQVAEQSLDVDFDVMFTDLAPMDLLLQRAGRLHRHARTRPLRHATPVLHIAGLVEDRQPDLKGTAWGFVYDPFVLLATWEVARRERTWELPDDIDRLVQDVYSGDPFEGETREAFLKVLDRAFGEHLAKEQDLRQRAINAGLNADQEPSGAFTSHTDLGEEDEAASVLLAATRLGDESCAIVPVLPDPDGMWRVLVDTPAFDPKATLDDAIAKRIFARQVRLGKKGLVQALLGIPVPPGFQQHPLLRNLRPLPFVDGVAQVGHHIVGLDPELGITYPSKEDA